MEIQKIEKNGRLIALIKGSGILLKDEGSALDLMMRAKYEAACYHIVLDKKLVTEDFFILSTGLAGSVLQKFINYGFKLAIFGDYSVYTSKPLKDFIYESNRGEDIFFMPDQDQAIEKLSQI